MTLTWELNESAPTDFSDCVKQAWEYSYDLYKPATVETPYTDEVMKEVMSNFFVESFIGNTPSNYYSGVELHTETCDNVDVAEVGFVGRTLLNALTRWNMAKASSAPTWWQMPMLSLILT